MRQFHRRQFLQSTSLLLAGGYVASALGADAAGVPPFAKEPTYDPTALFLTWQRDPTTTMTVQWLGSEKDAVDRPIWFAKQGTDAWRNEPAAAKPFPMTDHSLLRAQLSGLEPGSEYVFRVGLDSAEHRFRTMPAKATSAIQFVSGGDSGVGMHAEQTNRLAAAQSPMFVVLGGDIAYENGRTAPTFVQFLKNYSRDLRDDRKRLIPLLGCIGNHEVNGGYDKTRAERRSSIRSLTAYFPRRALPPWISATTCRW